jgi:hypothetical protein
VHNRFIYEIFRCFRLKVNKYKWYISTEGY